MKIWQKEHPRSKVFFIDLRKLILNFANGSTHLWFKFIYLLFFIEKKKIQYSNKKKSYPTQKRTDMKCNWKWLKPLVLFVVDLNKKLRKNIHAETSADSTKSRISKKKKYIWCHFWIYYCLLFLFLFLIIFIFSLP